MELTAALINFLGFSIGIALYLLLLTMVIKYREKPFNYPIFFTAVAGITWNLGELLSNFWESLCRSTPPPLLIATSFSALGFLLSFIIHSTLKDLEKFAARILILFGYTLSFLASFMNFYVLFSVANAPSKLSLQMLTLGTAALIFAIFFLNFAENISKKHLLIVTLAIFMISASHLSSEIEEKFWLIELIAHQASLPLAIMILLQDYRFAFVDLFLKRALPLLFLSLLTFSLYAFIALPLQKRFDLDELQSTAVLLSLWIITALVYPSIKNLALWLVEKLLCRTDYEKLAQTLREKAEKINSSEQLLDLLCDELAKNLSAEKVEWRELSETHETLPKVEVSQQTAKIYVPTTEPPSYLVTLKNFSGARTLLSEEAEALKTVALIVGRQIDTQRVMHERCKQEIREQEFSKLAMQAQLAALRAQINPHFLFNALTTIGYLIQSSPEKALSMLMRLTQLLRYVLRSTSEFITLSEEVKLIEAYLEIEKARFEERLQTSIQVPKELEKIRIPSLILQPLVENAIKHGISKSKKGGRVEVSASRISESTKNYLLLTVSDNGQGFDNIDIEKANENGIGLKNIKQRLENYYQGRAELKIETERLKGTKAQIKIPLT